MLTLLATPLLRLALLRARLLDRPNRTHKAHGRPVPALGGAAVVLAVTAAVIAFGEAPAWGAAVYAACAVIFLVGAWDDLAHLSPWQKLGAEILCSAAICAAGMTLPLGPGWIAVPATVLWLLACANGFNLTDGVDGLAALTGAIAAASLAAMAASSGQSAVATLLVAAGAGLAGFLAFNFPRASIFLGDSGALPVGFLLGICSIAWARQSPDLASASAPAFPLALPIGETVLSTLRRALRGDPIFRADRRHIHHRLAERGLQPAQVTLWCGAYTLAGAATGLVVAQNGWSAASAIAALAFAALTAAGVRSLRYAELSCAVRMLAGLRGAWPLAQQIRTTELRHALELAPGPEQRWERIVDGLRELGFEDVRLLGRDGAPLRQTSPRSGAENVWKLSVALPEGDGTLEAERRAGDGREAIVSDALVETLRRAFADEAPAPRAVPGGSPAGESSPS